MQIFHNVSTFGQLTTLICRIAKENGGIISDVTDNCRYAAKDRFVRRVQYANGKTNSFYANIHDGGLRISGVVMMA